MSMPYTSNCRNNRNQRNPKWKPKGEYVVWVEKEEKGVTVYSTNSVFWRDFFGGEPDKLLYVTEEGEKIYGKLYGEVD